MHNEEELELERRLFRLGTDLRRPSNLRFMRWSQIGLICFDVVENVFDWKSIKKWRRSNVFKRVKFYRTATITKIEAFANRVFGLDRLSIQLFVALIWSFSNCANRGVNIRI